MAIFLGRRNRASLLLPSSFSGHFLENIERKRWAPYISLQIYIELAGQSECKRRVKVKNHVKLNSCSFHWYKTNTSIVVITMITVMAVLGHRTCRLKHSDIQLPVRRNQAQEIQKNNKSSFSVTELYLKG